MRRILWIVIALMMIATMNLLAIAEETTHTHEWSSWATRVEAGCTTNGEQARVCTTCGETEKESISATGHNMSSWTTRVEPGCTTNGERARVCTKCGETEKESISATGHNMSSWTTRVEAGCTTNGEQARVCTKCGETEKQSISATGHNMSSWTTRVEADCTTNGERARVCTKCGETEKESLPATGHTEKTVAGKAATCTAPGLTDAIVCSVCNATIQAAVEIPVSDHTQTSANNAVAATCTAAGKEADTICSVCGTLVAEGAAIGAKGHTLVTDAAVEATCTANGLTAGEHCAVCDYKVAQEIIPAKGHTEVIIAAASPSCDHNGLTEGKYCSVCNEILVQQVEVPATGHDYKTVTIRPTTTSSGYNKYTCQICGDEYRDSFVAKLTTTKSAQAEASVVESFGEFSTIVYDVEGVAVKYTTEWATAEAIESEDAENILTIIATPDENGMYGLRELHLSFDLVEQLKEKEIDAISFIVDDAELLIPMSIFDDEMLLVVKEDIEAPLAYVFTVDPHATNEAGEFGCLVKMEISTENDRVEVAGIVTGLVLIVADEEIAVAESAVYVREEAENTAE